MSKLIAILNVIAWSGFWCFGYLALTTDPDASGRMVTAMVLAVVGAGLGLWAWFWLVKHTEEIGYAPKSGSRARYEVDEGLDV
ncbi:hypothetical protein [Pacificoceanicola onchidii]|uniref:hypothetical protein n=1 Tax=Pacificoceanicola onchidii TaxID=2562685 RepID=UPI0010A69E13|nr:hypothetical protein [Pacificoceanicola onchidii]